MKTFLYLIITLVLMTGSLSAQNNKASVSLSAAIYEEEVSGNLDKAVNLYLDILKKYPDDRQVAANTLYRLGLINEKMGKQKADEYFKRLVNTYPDQTEMVALAKARLTLYNSVASGTSLKAEQSFKLAADLFKQLKYEEAVNEYEKVIKLLPKSQMAQEAQLWIGHCYFKQGKNELALKSFNTILKDYPKSNLVPVAELMISQVKQAMGNGSQKRSAIVLDDKTILDTITGIRYTKINSWAGKKDVINSATSITDIFTNRKFLLAGNLVVPFDNSDSFKLNDSIYEQSRLSPDGTRLAFLGKNSISVIPVSPFNGMSTGPAQKLLDIQYQYGYDINWSPDGKSLIFSINIETGKNSIWMYSLVDRKLKQITNSYQFALADAVFSKNGSNFLYKQYVGAAGMDIRMKSLEGKSVSILDSCSSDGKHFVLSSDNKWIIYSKMSDKKMLFRMSDKQQMELSTPLEVGDFVSWSDKENKAFSFCPSSVDKNTVKVASVFGGPVFELEKVKEGYTVGWTKNGGSLLISEGSFRNSHLKMIDLTSQDTIALDGIDHVYGYPSLSPDRSKVLAMLNSQGKNDLSIIPVSLKDRKILGKPITIFKTFTGIAGLDYSWSPDGKSVAVCNQGEVYICSAEGGTPTQLTKTSVIENFPDWSPEGNAISVFIRSTNQLMILKATDGEVLMTQEKVDYWTWTPDGKEILIAFEDGQLNAVSITSGKSRKIVNWKERAPMIGLSDLLYSPDGKKIVINGFQNAPVYKTYTFLINVADGKVTELSANYDEDIENIKWSPDSKWISYSSYGKKRDRLESTLWEADLTDFMKKMKPGTEKGFTTDFDFKTLVLPAGGVPPDGTFTDTRDGHVYKYKKIGTQTWMTENLAYLPEVSPDSAKSLVDKRYHVYGYKGYDVKEAKNTENYQKYGVLYNLPAAVNGAATSNSEPSGIKGAYPAGWHLPSDAEWMVLERTLGMNEADLVKEAPAIRTSGSVDKKLKSPEGWDDDIFDGQSGFNALPGGQIFKGVCYGLNAVAWFWTSTVFNDNKVGARYVSAKPGVYRGRVVDKDSGRSIRCIKD